MPMPQMKRHTLSPKASVWNAITTEAAAYHKSDTVKIMRRPIRSATKPKIAVPMNRPAKKAATNPATPVVPNRPGVVVVRMPDFTSPGAI